jgi:hypothetical protein
MSKLTDLTEKAIGLGLEVPEGATVKDIEKLIKDLEPVDTFGQKVEFEEWLCEIKGRKESKLKLIRDCVKITEEQAEILNTGILNGSNNQGIMYFKK